MIKNKIFLLSIFGLSLLIACVITIGGHAAIKATSGDKFCLSCHSWMDPMGKAYSQDLHGGNNPKGLKAECASCHLPHENLVSYIGQKGINGITEGWHMIFNDPTNKDWIKNRTRKSQYVFDSGCVECHSAILEIKTNNKIVAEMHTKYKEFKGTDKEMKCVTCHINVGHKNLGKILHDIKNPPIGEWTKEELTR